MVVKSFTLQNQLYQSNRKAKDAKENLTGSTGELLCDCVRTCYMIFLLVSLWKK